jgi:serine/threonine protein kinase
MKDGARLLASPPPPQSSYAPPPAQRGAATPAGARALDPPLAPPPAPRPPRPAVDPATLAGQLLDGRYRVVKKIGEGGMSFVYLALDEKSRERVAIKVLSPALLQDRTAMERLRREAALAGKLVHPNVCHIMRLGETSAGLVYVVMPLLEGELLCDRTANRGQLPLPVTVQFVSDIAAGLQAAHELGIIHRDLKPENVMICPLPDGRERAVVMDFGLAKERRVGPELQKLTATGIVLGTPEFMSPEQLRGKPLDPRSDIYALGLMTYEMLTGQLPFAGRTQQDIMIARLKGEPIPLRKLRPELGFPVAVEKVLLTSTQRDPEHRYSTAVEFASALAHAALGDADTPSSLFGRLLRPNRRPEA